MKNNYFLITTTYAGFTTYGIAYVEYDVDRPILIETYPDLSPVRCRVERFVDACNRNSDKCVLCEAVQQFLESL